MNSTHLFDFTGDLTLAIEAIINCASYYELID